MYSVYEPNPVFAQVHLCLRSIFGWTRAQCICKHIHTATSTCADQLPGLNGESVHTPSHHARKRHRTPASNGEAGETRNGSK